MNIKQFVKSISDECWNIGFVQNSIDSILKGDPLQVQWMQHKCKDSWFADPFVLEVTEGEIHVLVEELYKPHGRGRIARLIIDRKTFELKQKVVVLELPTHLSFPAIIRKDDEVYIYPENGESRELNLYRYGLDSNECVKVEKVLDEPVADAVIAKINGTEMLFCTKQPNPNGNILYVYEKGADGGFVEREQYVFEENIARMAGDFFEYGGKLYRPTQECNVQYGHAVTLQEVNCKNGKFEFNEIRRMYSVHPRLNIGMHTWNMYKGIIVTDALGFDNMWLRRILRILDLH